MKDDILLKAISSVPLEKAPSFSNDDRRLEGQHSRCGNVLSVAGNGRISKRGGGGKHSTEMSRTNILNSRLYDVTDET